ncbi:hypothetical protein ACFPYI_10725 [Halomarina salina]|uniref:Uncharacterized protein n=1 Tax=Halomarina salina TaxID=1872699 RepID=A0ABD5RN12_9EURY|nr:hypothetical protein [Halomarina salina]
MDPANAGETAAPATELRPGLFACGVGTSGLALTTAVAAVLLGSWSGTLALGLAVATVTAAAAGGRIVAASY